MPVILGIGRKFCRKVRAAHQAPLDESRPQQRRRHAPTGTLFPSCVSTRALMGLCGQSREINFAVPLNTESLRKNLFY